MNLLDYTRRFPRENECLEYFIVIREMSGIICEKCGHNKYNWLDGEDQFECEQCGNLTSIKSGTVMEHSKLPIKYWFITIHILTSSNKTFSASELQQKLGYPEYEPVGEMLENLNLIMSKTENDYSFDSLLFACAKNQVLDTES